MNLSTHRQISRKLYKEIEKKLSITLDKKYFIYGNMKPDLDMDLFTKSHRIKDSLDFVVDRINNIMYKEYTSLKKFSVDIGIITHFLSDFFCTVHYHENTKGYSSLIHHVKYEIALQMKIRKILKDIPLDFSWNHVYKINKDNIYQVIYQLSQAYGKVRPSMENDIFYALKVSMLLSVYIINNSVFFINKKAAA